MDNIFTLCRQQHDTLEAFAKWRFDLLDRLAAIIRAAGQIQAQNIDQLTDNQVLLFHQLAKIEYLADTLQFGKPAEVMGIFRNRRRFEWQVEMILNSTQQKSAIA